MKYMKKIIAVISVTFLLISCWNTFELTQEYIEKQYNESDRSINLENTELTGFISLNEYKTEKEINNIYLSNNNIDVIYISSYDKLWKLDISNNSIRFIWDLNLPEKIRHIDLSYNDLDNIDWLEKYTQIKTLNLSHNNLDDDDLKNISEFEKLIFIKVEWNDFSPETLHEINTINARFLAVNQDPFN